MRLSDWIKKNGFTQREIAKKLGLSTSRLCRICKESEPTLSEVMAIEKLTANKVRMEDFLKAARQS